EHSDRRRVRPAAADELEHALALVLVGEPEVEVEHVPDVEQELLPDRLVEPVLLVEVVDHDLGQLPAAGLVPGAALRAVHQDEGDDDDEKDDRDHPENTTDHVDPKTPRPAVGDSRQWPGEQGAPLGAPCDYCQVTSLLVLRDVRVVPEEVTRQALVVTSGDRKPTDVRLDEVVLVVLEDERYSGLVDQLVLGLLVVLVALSLVQLGVRLLDKVVVARKVHAAPVEAVARGLEEDVEPVLLVGVVRAPSVGTVDVELALADAAGHGLAVGDLELH